MCFYPALSLSGPHAPRQCRAHSSIARVAFVAYLKEAPLVFKGSETQMLLRQRQCLAVQSPGALPVVPIQLAKGAIYNHFQIACDAWHGSSLAQDSNRKLLMKFTISYSNKHVCKSLLWRQSYRKKHACKSPHICKRAYNNKHACKSLLY